MSVEAISWALNNAPGVPPQTVATLIGLANHADPDGRGSYPSQPTLAHYTRKSDRSVRNDLARLEESGLIRRGDQRLVDHLPPDRRPIVWDLVMTATASGGARETRSGRKQASARKQSSARKPASKATGSRVPPATGSRLPPNRPVEPTTEPKNTPPTTSGPPKGAEAAKGTRLPDDFAVTSAMAEWARTNAPSCGTRDHESFCDYWRSVPGAKGRKLDWTATWRNWMRREHERRLMPGRANGAPPRRSTTDDRVAQAQALKAELGLTTEPQLNLIRGELA